MIPYAALNQSGSVALRALRRNTLQTVLTVTGMTIGVSTVLTMIALGTGAQRAIQDQVRSAGMNVILVSSGNYKMPQQWTSDGETEEQQAAWHPDTPPPTLRHVCREVSDPPNDVPRQEAFRRNNLSTNLVSRIWEGAWGFSPTDKAQATNGASAPGCSPDSDHTLLQRLLWTQPARLHLLHTIQLRTNPILSEDQDPQNAAGLGASDTLSLADADAVSHLAGVQYVSAGIAENARVTAADTSWFTRFHGESADIARIRRTWSFPHGRFFTTCEVTNARPVAVIGSIVATHLFGANNPVGATLVLRGTRFRIVGVIASATWMVRASPGDDQFDAVFIPVTTAQLLLNRKPLSTLTVSTTSTGEVTRISKQITALLRVRHALAPGQPNDFTVVTEAHRTLARGGMRTDIARAVVGNASTLDKVTLDQLGKTLDRASRTMTALLVAVAAVSLIVGGIGVMNIMLLSVTERTREIGIRRAVGARSQDVMLQFLMEAVLLSLGGGIFGIVAGLAASRLLSSFLNWSTSTSPAAVAISFGISAGIGILFGFYPARQASRVSPMTSLRYE